MHHTYVREPYHDEFAFVKENKVDSWKGYHPSIKSGNNDNSVYK
jgi:hypothetical protein